MFNVWGKIKELINRPYIVEQGETAIGRYIKWSNGLMICTGTIAINANTSESPTYFARAFKNTGYNVVATNIYANSKKIILTVTNSNASYFTTYPMLIDSNTIIVPTMAIRAHYIAIGFWK